MTCWHIALTEPGKDHIAAQALRNRGYNPYRPLLPVSVPHGRGQRRSVIKSMFPGYLLMPGEPEWDKLRNLPGIRFRNNILMINGRVASVDNAIVDEIRAEEKRQLTTGLKGEKIVVPYKVGDMVRIGEGPFSGLFGEISELDDLERICIFMSILGGVSRVRISHTHLALA